MPVFTVPLYEFNACHAPAGSPQGGQFCSKDGGGEPYEVHYDGGAFDVRLSNGAYLLLTTPDEVPDAPSEYMFVSGVLVPEERRGMGTRLYRAALQGALKRGYKGLSSDPRMRSPGSTALWKALARTGRVRQVNGYDVLEN